MRSGGKLFRLIEDIKSDCHAVAKIGEREEFSPQKREEREDEREECFHLSVN
jgi:hypothetical protein